MFRYIFILTVLFSSSAFADSFTVVKISDEVSSSAPLVGSECADAQPSIAGVDIGDIITIGQQVWKIVEAGKPVVTVNTPVAFALPRGLKCWTDLESWQPSRTQTYQVSYKNGFGMEVVSFRFRLQYTYGGGLQGKGRFLANVTVMPAELNVTWGYTFDADVQVAQAVNLGTLADPLAGLELNIGWNVKTVVKESRNSVHYFVQGDGQVLSAN